jgi:hypothetical protein
VIAQEVEQSFFSSSIAAQFFTSCNCLMVGASNAGGSSSKRSASSSGVLPVVSLSLKLVLEPFDSGVKLHSHFRSGMPSLFKQAKGFGGNVFPEPTPQVLRCCVTSPPGLDAIIPLHFIAPY